MSDAIDRQAAIDAMHQYSHFDDYDQSIIDEETAVIVIKELPSVQPEIIRCKDCAKREYCRTSTVWAVPPSDDWYCADAEPYKGEQI